MRLILVVVLVVCRSGSGPTKDPRAAVALFRHDSGHAFFRCEDLSCLKAHEAQCEPAELHEDFGTIEGTPATMDTFILKDASHCRVVTFHDFTGDYYGGCRMLQRSCGTIDDDRSDNWDSRGCVRVEVLRMSECKNPHSL